MGDEEGSQPEAPPPSKHTGRVPQEESTADTVILALTCAPHSLCATLCTHLVHPPRRSAFPPPLPFGAWVSPKLPWLMPHIDYNSAGCFSAWLAPPCLQGSPEAPRCGFSRKVVDALHSCGAQFGSFDILGDEAVRQGLKVHTHTRRLPWCSPQPALRACCRLLCGLCEDSASEHQPHAARAAGSVNCAGTTPCAKQASHARSPVLCHLITAGVFAVADLPAALCGRRAAGRVRHRAGAA